MIMASLLYPNKSCSELKERRVMTPKPHFLLQSSFFPFLAGGWCSWVCVTADSMSVRRPDIRFNNRNTFVCFSVSDQRKHSLWQPNTERNTSGITGWAVCLIYTWFTFCSTQELCRYNRTAVEICQRHRTALFVLLICHWKSLTTINYT